MDMSQVDEMEFLASATLIGGARANGANPMTTMQGKTFTDVRTIPVRAEPQTRADILQAMGQGALTGLRDEMDSLREVLWDIEAIGGDSIGGKIRDLLREVDTFEPAVTFIGQIKSGKTTLVNAMIGKPDLLPADVNPWTSVVTSLHLNVPRAEDAPKASFQLFDASDWDNLVRNGGRIGELSARTGADDEVERLRAQIAAMHEKTRKRLGAKFEMMLGQRHDFGTFDDGLIKRYVCMGDDYDPEGIAEGQGQFADITRSADLYFDAPGVPMPLCIRDTPGVNDTFMMREQITIRALRESRTCVVVLSAHQALSATDMGLIRLIANMKARQIVVFVNRIDELSDPARQIPEIRASLIETLSKDGGTLPDLVFGSAYWATAALTDDLSNISQASMNALRNYAADQLGQQASGMALDEIVWRLSGMPGLQDAIGQRVAEGAGSQILDMIRGRAANYVAGLRASSTVVTLRANDNEQIQKMDDQQVATMLEEIRDRLMRDLSDRLDDVFGKFADRVDQVHARFLGRALESLIEHLETYGENQVWNYSPDGLRMLMRSSYQVMRKNFGKSCNAVYADAGDALTDAYSRIFELEAENFRVDVPAPPETPQPIALAQTIALDLKTSWWKGWWGRRRGYRAFADGFRELIEAETAPMVAELKVTQAQEIRKLAIDRLDLFLREQREVLSDICAKSKVSLEELHGLFGVTAQDEREMLFDMLFDELDITPVDEAAQTQTAARGEAR